MRQRLLADSAGEGLCLRLCLCQCSFLYIYTYKNMRVFVCICGVLSTVVYVCEFFDILVTVAVFLSLTASLFHFPPPFSLLLTLAHYRKLMLFMHVLVVYVFCECVCQ